MLNHMAEERSNDNSEDSSYEDFKDEPEDIGNGRYRFQNINYYYIHNFYIKRKLIV